MRWRRLSLETERLPPGSPYRAAINIEEECIRALIVELEPGAAAIVGGACEKRSGPYTLNSVEHVADVCERALAKAEGSTEHLLGYRAVADHVFFGVPDTWTVTACGSIKYRRPDPESRVDSTELRNALSRAVTLALSEQKEDAGTSCVEVIHASVIETRIDGRRTSDPVGFRGEELSLSIFLSLLGREQAKYLRDIGYSLDLNPVTLVPLLQALSMCLPVPEAVGVLLDERHTDVFRLDDGKVVASQCISQGIRDMVLGVCEALNIRRKDSERLQRAYERGQLGKKLAAQVEQELLHQMWQWAVSIRPALASISEESIPPQVYVCGSGGGLRSLRTVLTSPEWRRGLRFVRAPQVSCFGPGDVSPVLDRTGSSEEYGNLATLCLAAYSRFAARPADRADTLLYGVLKKRGYTYSD